MWCYVEDVGFSFDYSSDDLHENNCLLCLGKATLIKSAASLLDPCIEALLMTSNLHSCLSFTDQMLVEQVHSSSVV